MRGAAREPAGDKEGLVPGRDTEPLELVHHRADRQRARIARRPGDRQRRRLDDDCRARTKYISVRDDEMAKNTLGKDGVAPDDKGEDGETR